MLRKVMEGKLHSTKRLAHQQNEGEGLLEKGLKTFKMREGLTHWKAGKEQTRKEIGQKWRKSHASFVINKLANQQNEQEVRPT